MRSDGLLIPLDESKEPRAYIPPTHATPLRPPTPTAAPSSEVTADPGPSTQASGNDPLIDYPPSTANEPAGDKIPAITPPIEEVTSNESYWRDGLRFRPGA